MEDDVFYFLNEEDIQTVAEDQLDRRLNKQELESVKDKIAERIGWYDAIADVLNENFSREKDDKDDELIEQNSE